MNCRHDDCFTCPYKDCIASLNDMARQDKAKRNNAIVEDFKNGTSVSGISERTGLTTSSIRYVLKKAGITDFRQNWEKQS